MKHFIMMKVRESGFINSQIGISSNKLFRIMVQNQRKDYDYVKLHMKVMHGSVKHSDKNKHYKKVLSREGGGSWKVKNILKHFIKNLKCLAEGKVRHRSNTNLAC